MNPYEQYAIIAVGGALGSCARFAVGDVVASRFPSAFPWGTFAINVTGSLVIGAFLAAAAELSSPRWRYFVAVGFCGGYTTFSTFAWETVKLVDERSYALALGNVVGSSIAGIAAVLVGAALARALA